MVKGIGGFGFLDNFHCEKTSFLTFGSFVIVIVLGFWYLVYGQLPTTDLLLPFLGFPVSYLAITVAFTIGGYLGVIYYRIINHKKPIFVVRFWDAKA